MQKRMNPSNSSSPLSFVSSFMNDRNLGNGGEGGGVHVVGGIDGVRNRKQTITGGVSNGVKPHRTVNPLEVPYLLYHIGNEINAHAYEAD